MKFSAAFTVFTVFALLAGCSPVQQPQADVRGTVEAAVSATVAALVTPTAAPVPVSDAELARADDRASFLITRYRMEKPDVTSLTKATYDVAVMVGMDTPQRRADMHMVVLDFAEHGGTGLRPFRIEGDNESVARRLGFASGAALAGLTPNQVVKARALIAGEGLLKYLLGT